MSRPTSFQTTQLTRSLRHPPRNNRFSRIFTGILLLSTLGWAQNACDVTNDGTVNATDFNSVLTMALGASTCTAAVQGIGGCNVIAVQRVVNAATGGTCSTVAIGSSHSVGITWVASITANVVGYNLYRAIALNSNFAKVNSAVISGTSYADSTVQAEQTYYYVATTVDSSNNESQFSTPVSVTVPTP